MTKKKTPAKGADEDVGEVASTGPVAAEDTATADASTPTSAEYTVAFSPRQVAVGFAILAGLVAIAIRHRRSRDRKPADD
jgi:hypothetical protein